MPVREEYLRPSETTTLCPWEGIASHNSIEVDGEVNLEPRGTIPL